VVAVCSNVVAHAQGHHKAVISLAILEAT